MKFYVQATGPGAKVYHWSDDGKYTRCGQVVIPANIVTTTRPKNKKLCAVCPKTAHIPIKRRT